MSVKKHTTYYSENHFIVAIGASAGGLEAIHEFFDHMPSDGNFSFVIIQHLSSDHKSLLVELVSKHTRMNVLEAAHGAQVEKGCVYVIPNDKVLKIKDGKLQLIEKQIPRSPNTAIDIFLKSLAEDQGGRAIAVILSGTGTDGTRGIEAIQNAGGIVLVQDPESAKFNGMPNSAIAAGYADYVSGPDKMPEAIMAYVQEKKDIRTVQEKIDEKALPEVYRLLEKHCNYDFHNYKTPTIARRILRRMNQLGKKTFNEYLQLLRTDENECKVLGKDFLIGVTKFFRDAAAFETFENILIPSVFNQKIDKEVVKVWIAACSSGQEAYSIAILLNEALRKTGRDLDLKIFATDIDIDAVEQASKGAYPLSIANDMSAEILERYFEKHGSQYVIIQKVRKQIVFARHNILKDPPFINNDIISCRNMLIYMDTVLQRKVFSTLLYSLNKDGYLFLGPSETPSSISSALSEVDSKWKIFKKISNERIYEPSVYQTAGSYKLQKPVSVPIKENTIIKELAEDFKNILTEEFQFAGVYIDRNYEIKEAIGDFRKYLTLPQKIVSLNVLKMVAPELSIALNTGLRKAIKQNEKIVVNNIHIQNGNEKDKSINFYIKPPDAKNGLLMIVFGENKEHLPPKPAADLTSVNQSELVYINELEDELKETRVNLQIAVESLETTNEELQSSNEELLSANEELQSSNEELQSLNEELHTLNTEHQVKIKELIELNDDLNNYFRSTDIGQIFVDKKLRIRKFNPAAIKLVNLIESDIGRPIEHISTNLKYENLLVEINNVINNGSVISKEVQLSNGKASLMRILPYVRQDKQMDGVIITFYDISDLKELNNIINGVFNTSSNAIMAFKSIRNNGKVIDFRWTASNYATDLLLGKKGSEYLQKSLKTEFPLFTKKGILEKLISVVESNTALRTDIVLELNGATKWFQLVANKMDDGLVVTLVDINEQKIAEEKLKLSYHELIKVKENLHELNNRLEEEVRTRTIELTESEERFRLISHATSDAIWDRDLVQNKIWWSDSFYNWFGYTKDEVETDARFWLTHIHPDDQSDVVIQLNKAINESNDWSSHYRFQKSDGTYINVFDKGSVIKDENGIPYRMVGAMMDVTAIELKELNERLLASNVELEALVEQRTEAIELQKKVLHNLFMQAPAIICTLNGPDHVFELVNPAYQKLFGKRQLTGLPVREALPELAGQGIFEILDDVYRSGVPFIGKEMRMVLSKDHDNEEEIYLNFIYQVTYDENNNINGILAFANDVTEQVRARKIVQSANEELVRLNKEFKFVTDFMPQMVWVTKSDGYHEFYNKQWYDYTGLTYEETKDTGWNTVVHPDDQERAWEVWRHSLQTGEPYEIEYRFRRYDGIYRWFLGRALPLKDENNNITKWFGTCTDVHDQKIMTDILEQKVLERTAELITLNEELEVSNTELMQFASVASHDLKEPLRKIQMFSTIIKERYLEQMPDGLVDYMNRIISSSARMTNLINDLLSFSRLSASILFEKTDLNAIVKDVLMDLEWAIIEKDAKIEMNNLPVIDAVSGQMRQVFQNIISNALKFSKHDTPPYIKINVSRVNALSTLDSFDPEGGFFRITIEDNGIGFNSQYADRIFNIFQRLHSREKYDGTGIGLSITKKIIEKHNGIIASNSIEGQGTVFIIVLPEKQEMGEMVHKKIMVN